MSIHRDVNLSFEDYNVLYDALLELQERFVALLADGDSIPTVVMAELDSIQRVRSKLEAEFQH